MVLSNIIALTLLWSRRRSVLDLWLMVVMCAYITEVGLITFPTPIRYSVGWYAGRACALLSASLVLLVLLYEITMVYAHLLRAVLAHRHEREARMLTGDAITAAIAHEIRQPLFAIISNASAGLALLKRSIPDLDEAAEAFTEIAADGQRAEAVIGSIRTIFKKEARSWVSLDVDDLIREALALVSADLEKHGIVVQAEPNEQPLQIRGDQIQLQQVLVNLITNAIDSMAVKDGPRILSVKSEAYDDGRVIVSVADTGVGISAQDINRIFDPLFTTKSKGMGMGLSICRSIIEAHDGRLWGSPNNPASGAVFRFFLPAGVSSENGANKSARSPPHGTSPDLPAIAD